MPLERSVYPDKIYYFSSSAAAAEAKLMAQNKNQVLLLESKI